MTDNAIKDILRSNELSEIEVAIANECKTYVNKDFVDFTIGILRREINNAGLTVAYVRELLLLKKISITELGIQILKNLKDKPIEEKYPKGGKPSEGEKTRTISSHGLGIGFAVKYAIYLDFLEKRPKELIMYLEKEGIPNARRFAKTLAELYSG